MIETTASPAWPETATRATAFWRGTRAGVGLPSMMLFTSSLGYGVFAKASGLTFGEAMFLPVTLQALPAQLVLADHAARNASIAAAALAVVLTAVRFLPMTVVLMPLLKGHGGPRWHELLAVHFVGVTQWLEGLRRLPDVPVPLRLAYYFGIGTSVSSGTLIGSALGYQMTDVLPSWLIAALLFMTPLYFLLSLVETSRLAADRVALVLGALGGPLMFLWVPGFDLLLTGLGAGTLGWALGRRGRAK
jgi:predicted branched-subunit amino acid permease